MSEIRRAVVGPMDNNVYLVLSDAGPALLVDTPAPAEDTLRFVAGHAPEGVGAIVVTHRHADHIGGLSEAARVHPVPVLAGTPDCDAIATASGVRPEPFWQGDELRCGSLRLSVIGLSGHTPGGVALVYRPAVGPVQLLVGDSLFPGGPGRTTNPADFARLMADLESKVFDVFDDDTVVWPGHGEPTTLGAERPHLAEWRERGW